MDLDTCLLPLLFSVRIFHRADDWKENYEIKSNITGNKQPLLFGSDFRPDGDAIYSDRHIIVFIYIEWISRLDFEDQGN
jgi:hypothetical protein